MLKWKKLIDIGSNPAASFLNLPLVDQSTKKNIIIPLRSLTKVSRIRSRSMRTASAACRFIIKPQIQKLQEEHTARTRKKAEVFTPTWLCYLMNNYCDGGGSAAKLFSTRRTRTTHGQGPGIQSSEIEGMETLCGLIRTRNHL